MKFPAFLPLAALPFLIACVSFLYEPVKFIPRGDTLDVVGVIDGSTADELRDALAQNSGITTLRLISVPGSADDERSLTELAALIRDNDLSIVVPADGLVASGGTDMLLMSRDRRIEPGACIGVHSWAAGLAGGSGADLPRDDPAHELYLSFYDSAGIPEEFYWYTLEVAAPEDMHWMSPKEINQFGLSKVALPRSEESDGTRQARCNTREPG